MKKKYLILIGVLITIDIILLYKVYTLNKYINNSRNPLNLGANHFEVNSVPCFASFDLLGRRYDVKDIISSAPFTLLIFFSLLDCADCLLEYELWKVIHKSRNINVVGIARHIDEKELAIWVENAKLDFPILHDRDSNVTQAFGIKNTPLKILVDQTGRIILADPVRLTENEKQEFMNSLDSYVKRDY